MSINLTLPQDVQDTLNKLRRPLRGVTVSQRPAECFVSTLNFLKARGHRPRLTDLAREMQTTQSGITRMEKDLRRANLIRGNCRRTTKFSKHLTAGQVVSTFCAMVAAQIEERSRIRTGIAKTDYDALSNDIFEKYKVSLDLEGKERKCKKLFEDNFLDSTGEFNLHRWSVEKLVLREICLKGFREYNLPDSLTFGPLPMSEGYEVPDLSSVSEAAIQNLKVVGFSRYDTALCITACPLCGMVVPVRLPLRQESGWKTRTHYEPSNILANIAICPRCHMKFHIHFRPYARSITDDLLDATSRETELEIYTKPENKY